MLKWDGGRAPEILEAVTRFLERHGQFRAAGVTAEEVDRRGKALRRVHPGWLVNSTTILTQGHTVARAPAAQEPRGGVTVAEVDPPPTPAPPPRVDPPTAAERAAAGRARELIRARLPRLGLVTPAHLPRIAPWLAGGP